MRDLVRVSNSYIYIGGAFCNFAVTGLYPGRVSDFFDKTLTQPEPTSDFFLKPIPDPIPNRTG